MVSKPIIQIRDYAPSDEVEWLRCRVLAFLDSAYFDDVRTTKETYSGESIELVAVSGEAITGLLDIEREECQEEVFGTIWHVATHPEYRRQGIAAGLLSEGKERARKLGITRLEAWTRDDAFVNDWYLSQGFELISSYYHVYPTTKELRDTQVLKSNTKGIYPMTAYLHYTGNDRSFLEQFSRVHECRRYDLTL